MRFQAAEQVTSDVRTSNAGVDRSASIRHLFCANFVILFLIFTFVESAPAQQKRCVWDKLPGFPANWVLNFKDPFDTELSNWNCDDGNSGYPNNGNLTGYYDAVIDDGTNVSVQPVFSIAISNLELSNGSALTLVDGTDFLLQGTSGAGVVNASTGSNIFMNNLGSGLLTEMYLDGNIRFTGGGQILMDDSPSNVIRGNSAFNSESRLILDGFTIEGAGNVGTNEIEITINTGSLIRANNSNRLTIDPGVLVTNNGKLQAGGGDLRLFDGGFDNSGGGIIEALGGSAAEFANATITGGTFESSGSGVVRALGGTRLIGPITNNARFEIPGTTVFLTGNLTNTNQVLIGTSLSGGALAYDADTLLNGGGEVILSDSATNQINSASGFTGRFTNGDNTIRGSGLIGGRFTNQGIIRADQATALVFQTADISGGGVNSNLMEATDLGTLQINIATVENAGGVIRATNGGTVQLTNSASVLGGNINVLGASRLEFSNGTANANITNSSQGTIAAVAGIDNFLTGTVNNPVGGTILVEHEGRFNLNNTGTYINAGTIRLNGSGPLATFSGTRLVLEGSVMLQGGGDIAMTNSSNNTIEALTGNATVDTLINQDQRIHGSGHIGRNTLQVINRGSIEADLPFVDSESNGTIFVDPGGTGLTNENVMRAANGGRLQLLNGRYINTGGLIEANAGSTIDMEQAVTIEGGTVRTNGSGKVNVNGEVTFDGIGMTLDADMQINQPQGRLNLISNFSNHKTITVDRASIRTSGTVNLTGGGNIVLVDSPNSRLDIIPDATPDRLVNVDNTISGAGNIASLAIENRGTIRAAGTNALFYSVPSGGFDNQGLLEVTGSGGMQIIGGPFTTSGIVNVAQGSSLRRDGNYVQTAGQTAVNGSLEVTFGNSIQIQGGTFGGSGTIIGPATINGLVTPGSSPGILNFTNAVQLLFGIEVELGGNLVDGIAPSLDIVNRGTDPVLIGFDQINAFDKLTLGDDILIDVNFSGAYLPNVGDFFDVLTGDTIDQLGGLNFQFLTPVGYQFQHELLSLPDLLAGKNRSVVRLTVTSAIPEPSSVPILLMFCVCAIARDRLRH